MEREVRKNYFDRLTKVWAVIGFVLTAVSLISLFGDVRLITFSEYLERIVISYRNLFHPILDWLSPFDFDLTRLEKDSIYFLFFSFERVLFTILKINIKINVDSSDNIDDIIESYPAWLKKAVSNNSAWYWLEEKHLSVRKNLKIFFNLTSVRIIVKIIFRILLFFSLVFIVKHLGFPVENIDDFNSVLVFGFVGILILPLVGILFGFLGLLISLFRFYVIFPSLLIFKNTIQRKAINIRVLRRMIPIRPKILVLKFKKYSSNFTGLLWYYLSIFLAVLLILGLNFYLKKLG